jgi:hypothetical protein
MKQIFSKFTRSSLGDHADCATISTVRGLGNHWRSLQYPMADPSGFPRILPGVMIFTRNLRVSYGKPGVLLVAFGVVFGTETA